MSMNKHMYLKLKEGDLDAFQFVFNAYSAGVYNLAFRILKNKESAEEIVQETFLKVWTYRVSICEDKDIWPFIYVMAKRLCYNQLRRIKYNEEAQNELLHQMSSLTESIHSNIIDIQQVLKESVDQLPLRQRQVWIMSREEGKSHREIADELGISQNTVKNSIVQTLKILRTAFREADLIYFIFFLFFL